MLALCARYQLRAVGLAIKDIQSPIVGEDGSPSEPPERATASHPSRSSRCSPRATMDSPVVTRRAELERRGRPATARTRSPPA